MLHSLQQERLQDLHAGEISQEGYDKLQDNNNNKLAHLHLVVVIECACTAVKFFIRLWLQNFVSPVQAHSLARV